MRVPSHKDTRDGLVIFCMLILSMSTFGQSRGPALVGARPVSMGGAFVSVADDGNAIYWNPAGLARMERIQVNFANANLFGLDIRSYYASFISRLYFIPVLSDYFTFGADWFAIHTGDEELEFRRDQLNLSLAFRPPQSIPYLRDFSIGVNLKNVKITAQLDQIPEADASGWGWDCGILYNLNALPFIPPGLTFGLTVYDGGGTTVEHNNTLRKEIIQFENTRWGLSYRPFEKWLSKTKLPISDPILALDVDGRVHFGLEFWLARILALRAGLRKDRHTDEKATLTFGLGLKISPKNGPETNIDYAILDSPVLPNYDTFGGSLGIKVNPKRRIAIVGKNAFKDIYASLYRHYGTQSGAIDSLKLKNDYDYPVNVEIVFSSRNYTESQFPEQAVILPRSTRTVPYRAIFKDNFLTATGSRFEGEVRINYTYQKNEGTFTSPVSFGLHIKNYLTWDDPAKATAFVTVDEPLVEYFVDETLAKKIDVKQAQWFSRYGMSDAVLLFHALQAYGVSYHRDEVTPARAVVDTIKGFKTYPLDKIKYPGELLSAKPRSGDCDDLSVLYATLLQRVGLASALVSGPGHIFMMFNTYIPDSQVQALPVQPDLFVKHKGTLWIPIETTVIDSANFTEAWQIAAAKINGNPDDWEIFEIAENQAKYPPPPPGVLPIPQELDEPIPDFTPTLRRDLTALEKMKEEYLQTFENRLKRNPSFETRNLYGVILGQNNDYPQAEVQFKTILAQNSTHTPACNNLGNVEFILGHFTQAESLYTKALDYEPADSGTYLNLMILYQIMISEFPEDSLVYQQKFDGVLAKATQLFKGNHKNAFVLLGFPEENVSTMAESFSAKMKRRIKQVETFIEKSFRNILKPAEAKKVVLDRYGAKGQKDLEEECWAVLSWIY